MKTIKIERNKTLKVNYGFKLRFHKSLKNVGVAQFKHISVFLKFNDYNMCIDSSKDHNHF